MRVRCYSVRLESLTSISEKAYRAVSFDGASDILPKSQVFGRDWDVQKSEAWWISAWILEKKHLQYSCKKSADFDSETAVMLPTITIEKHYPKKIGIKSSNKIKDLER